MDIAGIIALVACATSICVKMLFLFSERSQRRILERETQALDKLRAGLYLAQQRHKRLESEKKQFAAQSSRTAQNITYMETTLQELQERKQEEDEVREHQRQIIKGKKTR